MPTVTLSDATYAKLQQVAKPFIDTEDSTCARVLDFYLEHYGIPFGSNGIQSSNRNHSPNGNGLSNGNGSHSTVGVIVRLDPDSRQFAHTRLLSAVVDGTVIHRPKWNGLMNDMHIMARKRLGSFESLRKVTRANLRSGRFEEDGYSYLPEADLSIQGVDANLACENSFRLAKALNVPLEVTYEWRDKDAAAHPGQTGITEWSPKKI